MTRAVTPALGVVVLAALTVILAAAVGVATVSTAPPSDPASPFVLSAEVEATTIDGAPAVRISLVHQSPTALDVREIEIRVAVDGERLPHQPSVPYLSSRGFGSAPSGPFNPSADPTWERGERAGLTATGENAATILAGSTVRVEIYRDGFSVAATETQAG